MKSAFAPIQVRKGGGTFGHFTQLSRARISLGTKISSTSPTIILLIWFGSHKEYNNNVCWKLTKETTNVLLCGFPPTGFNSWKQFIGSCKKTYFCVSEIYSDFTRRVWSCWSQRKRQRDEKTGKVMK